MTEKTPSPAQQFKLESLNEHPGFKTIVENAPLIIWALDVHGIFTFSQGKGLQKLGFEPGEVLGKSAYEIYSRYPEVISMITRALSGESVWIDVKLGKSFFQTFCSPTLDEKNQIIGVIGVSTDISEFKDAEQALRISTELYELSTNAARVGVWQWDLIPDIIHWSMVESRLFGVNQTQLTSKDVCALIHPEDRDRVAQSFKKSVTEKTDYECEFRVIWSDKSVHWLYAKGEFTFNQDGKLIRAIGINLDITGEKHCEDELQRAKAASEQANVAKTNFLANVSHEIRTPIGVIMGFVELLKKQSVNFSPEHFEWLKTVERNAKNLNTLVDDLLDLTKIESQKFEIESIKFSLDELLTDVNEILKFKAESKGVTFNINKSLNLPPSILSDPTRLRQILLNVGGNAIKFTEAGSVEIFVNCRAAGESSLLEFTIKDSGIGLSPEQAEKIFQPFCQADSSTTRRFGGTGLGLYIARGLAQALGGDLKLLHTTAGAGSIFVATVVCSSYFEGQGLNTHSPRPTTADASLPLNGLSILLVEDSPDNQRLISLWLTLSGAQVDLAKNGNEGVDAAIKSDYDVVLMDLQMPELDGFQATIKLRDEGYTKPIVALTAHAMKQEHDRCLSSGFDDHIGKPINFEQLLKKMSFYLPLKVQKKTFS